LVVAIAHELEGEWPLLVRRVLYVAYEQGLYTDKRQGSYDSVGNFLGRARRAGLLSWDAVADTVESVDPIVYDGPEDFGKSLVRLAQRYREDRQAGQPVRLVAWSEHRGLLQTLGVTANESGVPIIAGGGCDSHTTRYNFAREAALYAEERDWPTVVLHLGDYDWYGHNIVNVLYEDLPLLAEGLTDARPGGMPPVTVERIALTREQIIEHHLRREDEEDDGGVQVDALPTPVLRAILTDAIESRSDPTIRAAALEREDTAREHIAVRLDAWIADGGLS